MGQPAFIPWQEPLALAASQTGDIVLLYSSQQTTYSGRYSYLACHPREKIEASDLSLLAQKLAQTPPDMLHRWFGYLGYGLKNSLETLPTDARGWINLPDLYMARFGTVYCFDHAEQTLTLWSDGRDTPAAARTLPEPATPPTGTLTSNMRKADYLQKVRQVLEAIADGTLYQANLTRKFMGSFTKPVDGFEVFRRLCAVSPAPYSAFIRRGDCCIASSSPELFLKVAADGTVQTRPIKGTAPRFADPAADARSGSELGRSEKNRAENLMIVDLMRNDLARSARLGSVKVASLFDVTTHATIHHMSSTVTCQRADSATSLDMVRGCFPPGSMTGAPKIRAMQLCSELEQQARGVYSGAIGWMGGDGACDLSVVIRTLIIEGNKFEFQVGGGIVADSTPEEELQETYEKARGILAALGKSVADIELL